MNQLKKTSKTRFNVLYLAGCSVLLASCAATQTALEHGSFQSSTQLSKTLFLDPVAPTKKTIYVDIKTT